MVSSWDTRYAKLRASKNFIFTKIPDAKKDFNPELNPDININHLSWGARQKITWLCHMCEHKWQASPNNRFKGGVYRPCPVCSRKIADQNRRETAAQKSGSIMDGPSKVAQEWDWDKNIGLDPNKISIKSQEKFWWVCAKCGNSYSANAYHRYVNGTGCRSCSFQEMGNRYRKRAAKKSFFGIKFPHLLEEWDYEKNLEPPENYANSSNKSVHWICKLGHKYKKSVAKRTGRQEGCPICIVHGTSRNELRIFCEIKSLFPSSDWRNRDFGFELDIFVPEIKLAIEYDGRHWHANNEMRDTRKYLEMLQHGIKLLRIREAGLPLLQNDFVEVPEEPISIESLKRVIEKIVHISKIKSEKISKYLSTKSFVANDEFQTLLSRLPAPPKEASFAEKCPDKIVYWDYKLNYPLTPDLFLPRSTYKAFWKCPYCSHHFKKSFDAVYSNKDPCQICSRKTATKSRMKNAKSGSIAKDIRPSISDFLDAVGQKVLSSKTPGSHAQINMKCPKCASQYRRKIKDAIKLKFLCRACGIK